MVSYLVALDPTFSFPLLFERFSVCLLFGQFRFVYFPTPEGVGVQVQVWGGRQDLVKTGLHNGDSTSGLRQNHNIDVVLFNVPATCKVWPHKLTCCHTEIEFEAHIRLAISFSHIPLTQANRSQHWPYYAWQESHLSTNLEVSGVRRPGTEGFHLYVFCTLM